MQDAKVLRCNERRVRLGQLLRRARRQRQPCSNGPRAAAPNALLQRQALICAYIRDCIVRGCRDYADASSVAIVPWKLTATRYSSVRPSPASAHNLQMQCLKGCLEQAAMAAPAPQQRRQGLFPPCAASRVRLFPDHSHKPALVWAA